MTRPAVSLSRKKPPPHKHRRQSEGSVEPKEARERRVQKLAEHYYSLGLTKRGQ